MLFGPVVDLEIRNDNAAAVEALRNLWSYRQLETLHLESCELTDQDLESIRPGNTRVKYVCLRHNQLVHPWVILAEKLPAITYLDCRENRFLKLDLQYMLGWQCANIEQMYLSKPLTQCACLKVCGCSSGSLSKMHYPVLSLQIPLCDRGLRVEYDTKQA